LPKRATCSATSGTRTIYELIKRGEIVKLARAQAAKNSTAIDGEAGGADLAEQDLDGSKQEG
jgi:hypothetical protein